MHRMLEAVSAVTYPHSDSGWPVSVRSESSTGGGVSTLELIETLEHEERRRVQLEESGAPIMERVEQASTVSLLTSVIRKRSPQVSAYCVVLTFDPNGNFNPGGERVLSGHLSREEAERVMPLWTEQRDWRTDLYRVEYRATSVQNMRRNGWTP